MIARLIRMPSHPRAPLSSALAAVFVALAAGPAVAADFGHARVLSAAGAPLLVSVPVTNLTAQEVDTLRVGLADEASWQAAGLTPPAPLSTFRVALEPGVTPSSRVLRISSTQAPTGSAIDILLISTSPTGRRQVQFTVLAQPDAQGWHTPDLPLAAPESSSVDGAPMRARAPVVRQASGESVAPRAPRRAGTVAVRSGDTLSEIAMARRVSGASYYQMIVAMWRANPDAFIQGNMNLVKTGARLTVPDAATIRAENPEDAKRLYLQQLADFDVYRGRAARGAALAPAVGGAAASGRVEGTDGNGAAGTNRAQDRLRLSAGDEAVSTTGPAGLGGTGTAAGAGGSAAGTGAGAAGSGVGATGSSGANSGAAAAGTNGAASGSGAMDGSTAAAPGNASPEDARAANARALAEQGGRVDALRRDVDALNRSAAGAGATPGAAGSSAEAGMAGSAGAGAGAGAAGAGAAGIGAAGVGAAGVGAAGTGTAGTGTAGTSAAGSAGAPAGTNTATAPSATGGPSSAADRTGGAAPSGTAGVAGSGNSEGGAGAGGGAASQSGNASQSGMTPQTGSAGQPGTGGRAGAAGQSGSLAQPGIVGQSGAAGQSGTSTQGGTTQGAGNQGGTTQGGMATGSATPGGPAAGSPGTNNASSAATNASGAASGGAAGAAIGVPGAAAPEGLGGNANTAAANDGDGASSLPVWLSDNLLVVITALLAIVAFIVAWMFRRAAARREDDDDGDSDGDEDDARRIAPSVAPVEIDPRLRKINLDLDEPPTDEPTPPRRRG